MINSSKESGWVLACSVSALVCTLFLSICVPSAWADPLNVVEFSFPGGVTLSDNVFFDVKESGADTDCPEKGGPISVTIKSIKPDTTIRDSITLQAVEINDPTPGLRNPTPNTCIFGNTALYLSPDNQRFAIESTVTITQDDSSGGKTTNGIIDTISVTVSSTSTPSGTSLTLTETGPNTGVFKGQIKFTAGPTISGSALHVSQGDIIKVNYLGILSYGQILPSPNGSTGLLVADVGDTIEATYNGFSGTTSVCVCGGPAGGGGGLVRPGLVLDFISGGGLGGFFESIFNPPSIGNDYHNQYGGGITINGKPFDIKNYSTTIQQQVLKIGKPANFTLKMYDERGAYTISHAGMYFHFKGDPAVNNADTWISWDKYKGIQTHDTNHILNDITVDTQIDGNYFRVMFTMTPQKTMPDSSLIFRMWDDKRAVGDVPIWGAIVIVDPNEPVPVKKVPENQYSDYATLQKILDGDGYYIPTMLNKFHAMPDIYTSLKINWVYDRGTDKLTMVQSDKSGNLLGTITCSLFKKTPQPTVTDHDYFIFTVQQLNRQNQTQEDLAKMTEAQKAVKILQELSMIRQNNFAGEFPHH